MSNTSSSWEFFTCAEPAWGAMLASCRHAKQTIDFLQYVFGGDDRIEREFAEVFEQKVREGVRVRILLDAVGSMHFIASPLLPELQAKGVEIRFHGAVLPRRIRRFIPFFLRDHRKLLIVDREEAHIGGVIVQERARTWRDTNVLFRGSLVDAMQEAFDMAWYRVLRMKPVSHISEGERERDGFLLLGNSYGLRERHLYRAFIRNIAEAKNQIRITSPYFFPNREFLRALFFARERGADVQVLLPKVSDNRLADFVARQYLATLRRHGIRTHLFTGPTLHAKTMTIDGRWGSVGSCNFDWLSFWVNYELNVVSTNRKFVGRLEEHFFNDLKSAEELG